MKLKKITIRIDDYDEEELQRVLKETKQTKSTFIRNAILEKIQRIDLRVNNERIRQKNKE